MKFFIDVNIAVTMSDAIATLASSQDIEVCHLSRRFPANTPDPVWIRALQPEGWVIISGDRRISRNPANRAAWQESGLTAFFLGDGWASRQFWIQAGELIRWFPIMVQTVRDCTPGSGFLLPFRGSVPSPIYVPRSPSE